MIQRILDRYYEPNTLGYKYKYEMIFIQEVVKLMEDKTEQEIIEILDEKIK